MDQSVPIFSNYEEDHVRNMDDQQDKHNEEMAFNFDKISESTRFETMF